MSAGTKWTPPVSVDARARAPRVSAAVRRRPSPSRSHCTAAPLVEHRSFERVAVGCGRLQEPVRRRRRRRRRCGRARSCRSRRSPCPRPARGSPARRAPPAGRPRSRGSRRVRPFSSPSPTGSAEPTMRGSSSRGTPNSASSSSSQSSVSRFTSSVRDAFVTSITCCSPPVSRQTRKLSTVPNASPSRAPCSRSSHSSFVAEKYGSGTRPVFAADQLGVELAAALGGAPVLPDDRRARRASRSRGPRAASSRAGS